MHVKSWGKVGGGTGNLELAEGVMFGVLCSFCHSLGVIVYDGWFVCPVCYFVFSAWFEVRST